MAFSKFTYLKSLHGLKMKAADYRVLVTLLDYANRDGSMAHPGTDRLAADCCMHRENIRQSLRRLCDGGYIVRTHQGGFQRGASDYRFPECPQQSESTALSDNHNTVENRQKPKTQQSHMTGTYNADQIDGEEPSDIGATPEPDLRPGSGQSPDVNGAESKDSGFPSASPLGSHEQPARNLPPACPHCGAVENMQPCAMDCPTRRKQCSWGCPQPCEHTRPL